MLGQFLKIKKYYMLDHESYRKKNKIKLQRFENRFLYFLSFKSPLNSSYSNRALINYVNIIFNNLFKNSIEALNSTTNPAIEITLKLINGNLILTFFDNGPGYDGNIDDLKKPYFSTKKSTGLGLSLIDKIITDNSHKMNITTNSYSGFKIEIVFNDKDISN